MDEFITLKKINGTWAVLAQSVVDPDPPPVIVAPPDPAVGLVPITGFGSQTIGGSAGEVFHVTNLAASGPGTLRDAVSKSNRRIVFDVAGDIVFPQAALDQLAIHKSFLTIDGFSAPAPGITLVNQGIAIMDASFGAGARPHNDVHDIIIRGLTVRKNGVGNQYALEVSLGYSSFRDATTQRPYNIVVHHCYFDGATDDQINFAGARNSTFCWNVVNAPRASNQNFWLGGGSEFLSFHHNVCGPYSWRNPLVAQTGNINDHRQAKELIVDWRNNVVINGSMAVDGKGTSLMSYAWLGGKANFIGNYYFALENLKAQLPRNAVRDMIRAYGSRADPDANTPAAGVWVERNKIYSPYQAAPAVNQADQCFGTAGPYAAAPVETAHTPQEIVAFAGPRHSNPALDALRVLAEREFGTNGL